MKSRWVMLKTAFVAAAMVGSSSVVSAGWLHRGNCDNSAQSQATANNDGGWCECFRPAAPPQGQVAIAIPGRLNVQSAVQPQGAEDVEDRIETLEKDLTRLTLLVEELSKKHQGIDADLTRLTLLVEKLVEQRAGAAGGQ